MSRIPGLSRAVGTAAGSTLALALLVCGCVFAAMAGPALSLHTQSQALHQTLAGLASTSAAVQVTAQCQDFDAALEPIGGGGQAGQGLVQRLGLRVQAERGAGHRREHAPADQLGQRERAAGRGAYRPAQARYPAHYFPHVR